MADLLLRDAEVEGARVDVRVHEGRVASVDPAGTAHRRAGHVVDCEGAALLPGLHDHHVHLLAMAAADRSLPLAGANLDEAIARAHAGLRPGAWLRAVGFDEHASGPLDRWRLDRLAPGRPVRVQHRSGALWIVSSAALEILGAHAGDPALERDDRGEPNGLIYRGDAWLGTRLPPEPPPDLAAVGARMRGYGVTGVTDCTPSTDAGSWALLAAAVRDGALPLRVAVTGAPVLATTVVPERLATGPVKVVLPDHALPSLDTIVAWFRTARGAGRAVAVHCVTRAALALALAAWDEVGAADGDRVEHASVAGPDAAARLAALGITVVTQPGFLAARGDTYLREVDPADVDDLYPCASLLAHGVAVGGSTDAPFGPEDPWVAVAAAVDRTTASGAVVAPAEALAPHRALDLFLAPLAAPGAAPRRVEPGAAADLCLLDAPIAEVLASPASSHVRTTFLAGEPPPP